MAARGVRESLGEANADVERITTHMKELYKANLTQVERFYENQRGGARNNCVLEGREHARAYGVTGECYLQHALTALTGLIDSRSLLELAAFEARTETSTARIDSDMIEGMRFRRRMVPTRRTKLIE